jgi:hypothetical protein
MSLYLLDSSKHLLYLLCFWFFITLQAMIELFTIFIYPINFIAIFLLHSYWIEFQNWGKLIAKLRLSYLELLLNPNIIIYKIIKSVRNATQFVSEIQIDSKLFQMNHVLEKDWKKKNKYFSTKLNYNMEQVSSFFAMIFKIDATLHAWFHAVDHNTYEVVYSIEKISACLQYPLSIYYSHERIPLLLPLL